MNERELEGRSAIVTGGSRGIGKALALALASAGANVLINYRNSASAADEVVSEIETRGGKGVACRADLADPDSPQLIVDTALEFFGGLDFLVNNAGVSHLQPLGHSGDWAEADRLWAINTLGVVRTVRAAAPVMADGGRIITIGSVSGKTAGMAGCADYCGSKAAIAGYTRAIAHDLAPRRITANVIESGMMNTEMAFGMPEDDKLRIMAGIALNRFGDLNEIAALVRFLVSPSAAYITGATLTIDGGFSA